MLLPYAHALTITSISIPSNVTACAPTSVSWTGGAPAFRVVFSASGGYAARYTDVAANSVIWDAALPVSAFQDGVDTDAMVSVTVIDAVGSSASMTFAVAPNPDGFSACGASDSDSDSSSSSGSESESEGEQKGAGSAGLGAGAIVGIALTAVVGTSAIAVAWCWLKLRERAALRRERAILGAS